MLRNLFTKKQSKILIAKFSSTPKSANTKEVSLRTKMINLLTAGVLLGFTGAVYYGAVSKMSQTVN